MALPSNGAMTIGRCSWTDSSSERGESVQRYLIGGYSTSLQVDMVP